MGMIGYIVICGVAAIGSAILTRIVQHIMTQQGVVDCPKTQKRKIHKTPIPLGGGIAIGVTWIIGVFIAYAYGMLGHDISIQQLIGIAIGCVLLLIGGYLDDRYQYTAKQQIIAPMLAVGIVMLSGVGIDAITHPLSGVSISLNTGLWYVLWIADILIFFWILSMMFATKLVDGLDGLVTGIGVIGGSILCFLSMQQAWFRPEVSIIAAVFVGACLGFLVFNWHPASIFLGEGGSLCIGYMLAVIAIVSGGKFATALLVMGLPFLDMIRVIMHRIRNKQSIFIGDSEHLHFKLLHSGLNHRQAVLLMYTICLVFGVTALFLQTHEQIIALIFLCILMLLLSIWFSSKEQKKI